MLFGFGGFAGCEVGATGGVVGRGGTGVGLAGGLGTGVGLAGGGGTGGGLAGGGGGVGGSGAVEGGGVRGVGGAVGGAEEVLKVGLFRGHGDVIHYEETIVHYLPKVNTKNSQLPKWFIQNQMKLLP